MTYSRSKRAPWGELNRFIKVRTEFIGFHQYDDAPDKVAFLKNNHRHRFKVACEIEVTHDNRELEFFTVQEVLDREIIPFIGLKLLGSCEMIAEDILWGLVNAYGLDRYYEVVVSEDGENDGTVTYEPLK